MESLGNVPSLFWEEPGLAYFSSHWHSQVWWVMPSPPSAPSFSPKVSLLLPENTVICSVNAWSPIPLDHNVLHRTLNSLKNNSTKWLSVLRDVEAQIFYVNRLLSKGLQHRSLGEMDVAREKSEQHKPCYPEDDPFLLVLTQCAWPKHISCMFLFLVMGFKQRHFLHLE